MKNKEFNKDREFAVILERIHTDIKIIIEDLTEVKKRVDAIFEEQGRQKEEIFIIKADIRIMKADINTLKEDIKVLKEDVKLIRGDLKTFDKRLTHLEALK